MECVWSSWSTNRITKYISGEISRILCCLKLSVTHTCMVLSHIIPMSMRTLSHRYIMALLVTRLCHLQVDSDIVMVLTSVQTDSQIWLVAYNVLRHSFVHLVGTSQGNLSMAL